MDEGEAAALADFADVIFVGVKPQYLGPVLEALAPHVTPKHTVVSIAAGWTMAQLEAALPEGTAVLRVMPNTPILVGEGACVYCLGTHARDADRRLVHKLLSSCGLALEVTEDMIDAVIGVAGSAPAYMFQVLEGAPVSTVVLTMCLADRRRGLRMVCSHCLMCIATPCRYHGQNVCYSCLPAPVSDAATRAPSSRCCSRVACARVQRWPTAACARACRGRRRSCSRLKR
jgi:NADP oxidoreductase coenzyme F420-dependent